MIEMNTIRFEIHPSKESNDHQVRIIIDNSDFPGDDYLGIDPPQFFAQKKYFKTGELLIGRCTCGCVECGDYIVQVSTTDNIIIWSDSTGRKMEFDKSAYENVIYAAKNDCWEDYQSTC